MKQIHSDTGICFFKVAEPMDLSDFLKQADYSPLSVDPQASVIDEWLDYGCVYIDGRRQRQNVPLLSEQVIRLHTRRKRYWQAKTPLADFIVENNEEFLVLDKPAGLPTHPTLDNFRDNAKVLLEKELQIPLYTTHRLDIPTEGLLIIAKTPGAQRVLNRGFSLGRVEKTYRSINEAEAPLGLHTHYMDPEGRAPRVVQREENTAWWRCQLEILRSGKCTDGNWHEIRLLTGKTHQIRAQMSLMGAPVLGDTMYGGEKKTFHERIALECYKLSFTFRSGTFAISRPKSIVAPHFYS